METTGIISKLYELASSEQGYNQLETINNFITRLIRNREHLEYLKQQAVKQLDDGKGQDFEIIKHISSIYLQINAPFDGYDCLAIWQNNSIKDNFANYLDFNFARVAQVDDEVQLYRWSVEAYDQYKETHKKR